MIFTASLSLLKSTGTDTDLLTSNLSTLLSKLFKLLGAFLSLSKTNLSTLNFKLAKSTHADGFIIKYYFGISSITACI